MVNDANRAVASRARRRATRTNDGYSLLQIVITLAVVSILVSTALPTTMNALRNYRLIAATSAATGIPQAMGVEICCVQNANQKR